MHRSPLVLAALASAAVPGLAPVAVRPAGADGEDGTDPTSDAYDVAVVTDERRRDWVVRVPCDAAAGARLEQELVLLERLEDLDAGALPFEVPRPAGTVPLREGGRALVCPRLPGLPLHPGDLVPGPGLAAALGRALARLHELPVDVAEDVGLPSYTAEEHRERRLAELDRAASTGQVPPGLLSRWEKATEDVGRWRFVPCLVHGDLTPERVLADGERVAALVEWGEAHVADPADDLAWVAVGAGTEALDSVLEAYAVGRGEQPDHHLAVRARLTGEIALARWLLHGVHADDAAVVDDAVQMLRDLDLDVGGEAL